MESGRIRNLAEPLFNKLSDIQPAKSGYNLYLRVVSKSVLIDIKRIDTTRVVICDFIVGDETGVIKMRLRNEKYVDMIKEGDSIIVRNCKISVVNTHIRMQVDAFGKIELSVQVIIPKANINKNLSEDIYDNYANLTPYYNLNNKPSKKQVTSNDNKKIMSNDNNNKVGRNILDELFDNDENI